MSRSDRFKSRNPRGGDGFGGHDAEFERQEKSREPEGTYKPKTFKKAGDAPVARPNRDDHDQVKHDFSGFEHNDSSQPRERKPEHRPERDTYRPKTFKAANPSEGSDAPQQNENDGFKAERQDREDKPRNDDGGSDRPFNREKRSFGDRPYGRREEGGSDRPFNREKRSFGDRPYGRRDEGGADRPFNREKREFGGRREEGGADRPFNREKRSFGDRPYARREEGGADRPFNREKREFGDRPARREEGGADRPFNREKREFGDRPYARREEGGADRPFNREKREFGDRPNARREEGGADRPFNREKRSFGDRPYGRREEGGSDRPFNREKREFGDRPFGRREEGGADRPFDREKRSFGDRPFGRREEGGSDRPFNREKREFGDRPYGRREEGGADRPFNREKRSFGDRPYGRREEGGADRPFDREKRSFGDRPYGRREEGGSDRPFDREKRSFGDRPYGRRDEGGSDRPFDRESRFGGEDSYRPRPEKRERTPSGSEIPLEKALDENGQMRLNKFISRSGVCSRREADKLIEGGRVMVNGVVVKELGVKVSLTDKISYGGRELFPEKMIYVVMNKPKDYVTTTEDPNATHTVMDLLQDSGPERLYPVGRLDRDTTGVLLFTNDGELTRELTHPSFEKKKIYQINLDRRVNEQDLQRMIEGAELEDGFFKPDRIEYSDLEDPTQLGIEIHSGKNRIVRRFFDHFGYKVEKLDRVYFAGLTKKGLTRGKWRFLKPFEVGMLKMGSYE